MLLGWINMSMSQNITVDRERHQEVFQIIMEVYDCLNERGYNPINQIVGYVLSEDPTHITTHGGARTLISKLDRDEILEAMLMALLEPNA